jgi:hypothetical protein
MRVSKYAQHDSYIKAHYKIDMTSAEIAAKLKMPKATVISRYQLLVGKRRGRSDYIKDEDLLAEDLENIEENEFIISDADRRRLNKITLPKVTLDRKL